MYYRFSVSSYEDPALEDEVALALDARSALSMRKRGAKPTEPAAPKEATPQSQKLRKLLGIAIMVAGAALLLYVRMVQPQAAKPLQIVGFLILGAGLLTMRSGAPEGMRTHASTRSQQKAQKLMASLRHNSFVNGLDVTLSDTQMTLSTKSRNVDVAYEELHSVIETQHLWFVTYGQAGVVLQKRDLTEGDANRLLADIAQASGCSTEIVRWQEQEKQTADEPSDAETTGE